MYRLMTSAWQGAPYIRRYEWELVSKPFSDFVKERLGGGYRSKTQKVLLSVMYRVTGASMT